MDRARRAKKDELWLCQQNIARFRARLSGMNGKAKRTMLTELLALEEERLDQIRASLQPSPEEEKDAEA